MLDEALAAGEGVIHGVALALAQNGRVATLAAGHGPVVCVLGELVSQAIADSNALEVDVAVLVLEDLRRKGGNVVSTIRLSGNVEVLSRILGELVEEEREKGVNVLASSDSVADGATAVGVADVDRLVQEDDGSIVVPCVWVVNNFDLLVDGSRSQLKEETGEGRTSRATIEPQDDWVVLGVVARLEEPYEPKLG